MSTTTMTLEMTGARVHALLAPIPGESPVGGDARYDGTYDAIREARREDDAKLPAGIWQRDLKSADWVLVDKLCSDALQHRTKDLQIAGWLVEAWLRVHGFAGARDGMTLLIGLCERYWADAYPRIDEEGDADYRAAPFDWINEKLSAVLHTVPVTAPSNDEMPSFAWADWKHALWVEQLRAKAGKNAAEHAAASGATYEQFQASLAATPSSVLRDRIYELRGALEQTQALQRLLDERLGRDAPSLVRFRDALTTVSEWMLANLQSRQDSEEVIATMPEPAPLEVDTAADDTPPAHVAPAAVSITDPVLPPAALALRGREDAYRNLLQIADYLMKVEPHSPVPYLIRRAVSWGNMTLADLLLEFNRDDLDLQALRMLLGISERN